MWYMRSVSYQRSDHDSVSYQYSNQAGLQVINSYVAVAVRSPSIVHCYGKVLAKSNHALQAWRSNCPNWAVL